LTTFQVIRLTDRETERQTDRQMTGGGNNEPTMMMTHVLKFVNK